MKTNKNNNLILINIGDKKYYFSSIRKAGNFLTEQSNSVYENELVNNNKEKITIELVDGSNIPYKYID